MTFQEPLPTLSTSESRELAEYRALSGLAVLSLLFGLLSVTALAHPACWLLPLLATALGAGALGRIRRNADTMMGTPLAVVGLTLGLFFLSWAPTSFFADRWLLNRQSRQFGEQWMSAVFQGDLSKAYQATLAVRLRQPVGTALDEFYENNEIARAERDAYFETGLAKRLAELRGVGRFVFDRSLGITFDRTYALVVNRYFVYRGDEDQPALHLQLEMIRESDPDGVYWTLIKLADAAEVDRLLELARRRRS